MPLTDAEHEAEEFAAVAQLAAQRRARLGVGRVYVPGQYERRPPAPEPQPVTLAQMIQAEPVAEPSTITADAVEAEPDQETGS
jgi:hypothetical protein